MTLVYAEVIKRIRQKSPFFQNRVGGTAAFEAMTKEDSADIQTPHAWVVPLQEVADDAANLSVPQKVRERFGVVIAVSNAAGRDDGLGLIAMDQLRAARQELVNALMGWEPTPFCDSIRYAGARHLSMSRSKLWHQTEWSVGYYVKPVDQPDACVPLREAYKRLTVNGVPVREPGTDQFEVWFDGAQGGLVPPEI